MAKDFPKIIWQTHNYTIDDMPEHVKMVCSNWINLNPGWQYRYVNHIEREGFVRRYPEILPYYLYLSPKLQSDVWRYLVTYEYGGLYADMDSVCIKPVDYMLDNIDTDPELIVIPKELNHGSTGNGNYIIKDHSTIMKSVVDKLYRVARLKDLWNDEWLPFNLFILSIENRDDVLYDFTAALHSRDFHNEFPDYLKINFYGEQIKYNEFLDNNSMKKKYEHF